MAGLEGDASEKPVSQLPAPPNNDGVVLGDQSVDAPSIQVAALAQSSVENEKKRKTKTKTKTSAAEEQKKKKPVELRLTLTREEIEEDLYGITGMKLSRYPRKHPKTFPKHIRDVSFNFFFFK